MLEVLQFIFSSGWVFVGTFVLIIGTLEALAEVVKAWRGK